MASIAFVEVVIAFAALALAIVYFRRKRDPRYPPGPPSLPVLGNVLQLGTSPHKVFTEWAKKYGSMYSFKLGSEDVIMLNDPKLIKEVMQDQSSAGRTPHPVFLAFGNGNHGVVMAEGPHWEEQRRFTLRKLRDFGFAKSAMEGLIMEEANSLIRHFDKRIGTPVNGNRIFNGPVVNSLWNIISGERQEWDAPEQPKILIESQHLADSINRMTKTGLMFAPFVRYIAPKFFGWTDWISSLENVGKILDVSVQRHIRELDENNPQDFLDHYLIEKKNSKDPNSSFYGETGEKNLKAAVPDLFLAGSETTSHTLSWSLLLLAHHQDIQKKLQKELDTVVGQSRQPSLADRPNLPYTEAVMTEVLRRTTILPTGVPHRMFNDAVYQGHLFPKNTSVFTNLYYVHNNPDVWGDPQNFRPERFLSTDGKKFVKNDNFMPFSVGKRQCLGMSLAQDTLYLFLTTIFQKYHVKRDPNDTGDAEKHIEPGANFLNETEPFKIILNHRL